MAEVIIVKDPQQAAVLYATTVANALKNDPNLVLGLATGSTPVQAYRELAKIIQAENIDVSQVQGFALDEYAGLSEDHPESYHNVIQRTVTQVLNLTPELVHVPNGSMESIQTAGKDYDEAIECAGGIDIQILGIGTDGHIGFNEPGSSLSSGTRIKTLTQQTREDNARFFNSIDEVPTHCITQGIGTIMKARHVFLLAFGENKADAVVQTV